MKVKKFLGIAAACFCVTVLFSSCSPGKIELSPEEAHKLCETYADDVDWASKPYNGTSYMPLESIGKYYSENDTLLLCSCEIIKAEFVPSNVEDFDHTFVDLTLEIKDVYIGDSSAKGKTISQLVYQECKDTSHLVGKKYVSFIDGVKQENLYFYTPWTFLITDDNTLVSPFGCPVEDEEEVAKDNLSMDSRNYTGQKLDYFIAKVKEVG